MDNIKAKMLIVDDDEAYCDALSDAMKNRGFATEIAFNQQQALQCMDQFNPDYAVVDLRLGQDSGLQVIKQLLAKNNLLKIVILTGYASIATAVEAVKLGAIQYITKPANADEILSAFLQGEGDPATVIADQPPSVKRQEWEYVQKVLLENNGNISEAARQLNMHRRTLQRKLAKRPVRS